MEIIIISAITIGLCIGINAIQIYFNKLPKIQKEPTLPITIKPKRVTFEKY